MSEEAKFARARLILEIDEKGRIVSATDEDAKALQYAPDSKKHMDDGDTQLRSPNACCWRYIPGVGWRCRPEYC